MFIKRKYKIFQSKFQNYENKIKSKMWAFMQISIPKIDIINSYIYKCKCINVLVCMCLLWTKSVMSIYLDQIILLLYLETKSTTARKK